MKPLVEMLCETCNQWKDIGMVPNLRASARGKVICIDCIIKKNWKWVKRNIVASEVCDVIEYKELLGKEQIAVLIKTRQAKESRGEE
ncbi:MAG: hypothetical protein Q8M92_10100 [Candidatus Subteraquimicrobiales bacterium]|nr:hypothetical protein [Candidatus Subteraquimicrobiales bacterium]